MAIKIDEIIKDLEYCRDRLAMFVHPVNVANVENLLTGLSWGLRFCGIQIEADERSKVWQERGWKRTPVGPVPQMRERGMSERQIIDELIDIEIALLRGGRIGG